MFVGCLVGSRAAYCAAGIPCWHEAIRPSETRSCRGSPKRSRLAPESDRTKEAKHEHLEREERWHGDVRGLSHMLALCIGQDPSLVPHLAHDSASAVQRGAGPQALSDLRASAEVSQEAARCIAGLGYSTCGRFRDSRDTIFCGGRKQRASLSKRYAPCARSQRMVEPLANDWSRDEGESLPLLTLRRQEVQATGVVAFERCGNGAWKRGGRNVELERWLLLGEDRPNEPRPSHIRESSLAVSLIATLCLKRRAR